MKGEDREACGAPPDVRKVVGFAALLALPLVVFVLVAGALLSDRQADSQRTETARAARGLANALNGFLDGHLDAMRGLAASTVLDGNGSGDFAAFRTEAQRVLNLHTDSWVTIILRDRTRQLVNLRFPAGAELPSLRDPGAADPVWRGAPAVVGDLAFRKIGLFVPVERGAFVDFAIAVALEPPALAEVFRTYVLPRQAEAWIIDGEGTVLAHSDRPERLFATEAPAPLAAFATSGGEEALLDVPLSGSRRVVALHDVPGTNWAVAVGVPPAGLATPGREGDLLMLVLAGMAALGASLGLAVVGWRVVQGEEARRLIAANAEMARNNEHQRVLLAELDHRVKNMLAIVVSIAGQSARHAGSLDAFMDAFQGRIGALAKAHSLLSGARWRGVRLADLIREEAAAFDPDGTRVSIDGPGLTVAPRAATDLSLVIHELFTNAAKYGALTTEMGTVSITLELVDGADEPVLRLVWREIGGPPPKADRVRGFGSELIEATISYDLQGRVKMDFRPEGLCCVITIPSSGSLAGEVKPAPTEERRVPEVSLKGLAVLVVEDEAVLATASAEALRAAGCEVLGPVGDLEAALDLVERRRPDAAILDINLHGLYVFPLADRLARDGVPFLFATGYEHEIVAPLHHRSVRRLAKPFDGRSLVAELQRLVEGARAA